MELRKQFFFQKIHKNFINLKEYTFNSKNTINIEFNF